VVWRQGEHLALVGTTGSGKTFLARSLLRWRKHVVFLKTKPDDIYWGGWRRVREVKRIDPRQHGHWILDPAFERQWSEFSRAMSMAWTEGGWTVYADEAYYLTSLGLEDSLVKLLTQGRSKAISVVVGMQRPAWVSRFALSEPTHVFAFRLGDKRDLRAISEGVSDDLAQAVPELDQYQFAYYHKVTRRLRTGTAQDLEEILNG
jgi:hypothetical protein